MTSLLLFSFYFIVLHTGVSGTRLRDLYVQWVGERAYTAAFAIASLIGVVGLSLGYRSAFSHENSIFWDHSAIGRHLATPVMLLALFLVVAGVSSPSPTRVGGGAALKEQTAPAGAQAITRHPFLWGVMIWAVFHLFVNGDAASLVLFSTFLVVAARGTVSIDAKRSRRLGTAWQRYLEQTSNVPFAAVIEGRARLSFRDVGIWRVLGALVAFGVLVSVHPWLFGVYPLPGMAD